MAKSRHTYDDLFKGSLQKNFPRAAISEGNLIPLKIGAGGNEAKVRQYSTSEVDASEFIKGLQVRADIADLKHAFVVKYQRYLLTA